MNRLLGFAVTVMLFYSPDNTAMQKPVFDINLLNESSRQAYARLFAAEAFAIGPVGFAARTSENEKAFRVLLADPRAVDACRQLLADAKPEGQTYGLLGLYLKDREAFDQEASRIQDASPEQQVTVMSGCLLMPEGMKSVIGKFEFYASVFKANRTSRVVQ